MGQTIAACIPVLDDVESLRITIPYTQRWADQIVIVDAGSGDGTKEFLKWFLRPQDKVIHLPENGVLELGLDRPRNRAAEEATTDWIFSLEADCFVKPQDTPLLRKLLTLPADVLRIKRINIQSSDYRLAQTEHAIENAPCDEEFKDWIYRRNCGCEYRGYVHEELFQGDRRAVGRITGIHVYHLSRLRVSQNLYSRTMKTAYRMRMVAIRPELLVGVNSYWWTDYYPKHQEYLDNLATQFAQQYGLPLS